MSSVGIGELKNRLSAYLDRVRRGEEIIVRDRSRPFAKIVPLSPEDLDAEEEQLVAAGVLRPPEASFSRGFWSLRAPRIDQRIAAAAVSADRDER
jgi:prevent-host-death family protein